MANSKRIILKLSGESLKTNNNIFDIKKFTNLCKQIFQLNNLGYEIGIILGGGNIWRGNKSKQLNLKQINGDYLGMLATLINSLILKENLVNYKLDVELFSSLNVSQVSKLYTYSEAKKALLNKKIVIFAGGIGLPFFTTDTAAILRAIEVNATMILMGKNGVNGVFDKDPRKNNDAKFYDKITYEKLQAKKLQVMDLTASALAMQHRIKLLIFDINKDNSLLNVLKQKSEFTLVE